MFATLATIAVRWLRGQGVNGSAKGTDPVFVEREFPRMLARMRNDELVQAVRVAQRPNTWEPYMYRDLSAELRGRGMLDEALVVVKAFLQQLNN